MPVKDDIERILPDQVIKTLSQRKALFVASLVVCILLFVVIALAVLLKHCSKLSPGIPPSTGGCRTAACLHAAGWLADNMDTTVNPCDDFYRYSCGGWEARHSIPPDHSELTALDLLEDEIDERLREIIERIPPPAPPQGSGGTATQTSAEGKLQIFYTSCIHDYGRAKEAGRTLMNLIVTTLKGWYVLNPTSWNSQWDFNQAVAGVQSDLLVYVFFDTRLNQYGQTQQWIQGATLNGWYVLNPTTWNGQWDFNNAVAGVQSDLLVYVFFDTMLNFNYQTKQWLLGLHPSDLGMYYWNFLATNRAAVQDAYKDYMRRIATLLLRDANVTVTPTEANNRVEQFVNDAYGLENEMALMRQKVLRQGKMYVRWDTTIGELQNNITQFNWMTILTKMFGDYMPITTDKPVRLNAPAYFTLLNELIRNETDQHIRDRVFNNYLVWRIALKYASDLSWEYREAGYRFQEAQYGAYEWPPVWKICLETVHSRLGSLLAMEFIKNHIGVDTKNEATDLFNHLQDTVGNRVLELKWMDNITSARAFEKLKSMKQIVGFSELYYNTTFMDDLHSTLNVSKAAGHFQNLLSVNKFQRRARVRIFLNTQENFIDHLPVLGYSAHYWATPYFLWYYNTLLLPAGSMIDPLYSEARPHVFNYGVLGTLMATEMFVGVGEAGRYYWTNGSFANWWTNATSFEYRKATECFQKYFDKITLGPYIVNGQNRTYAVNGISQVYHLMDDLGGIRTALRAYKEFRKTHENEVLPVGLDMTPEQLFFVSSVQTKCYLRTDALAYQYATYRWLPEDAVVNSLLSHMPEFSDAFSCPVGSNMRVSYECEAF